MRADLHIHTTASDGALSAAEVVGHVRNRSLDLFSITDHDNVDSIEKALTSCLSLGLNFVAGIELSCQWREVPIHVVGLNICHTNPQLGEAISAIRQQREARGASIGAAFEALGIEGLYEHALEYAGSKDTLSRTHFARALVARGLCNHTSEVFQRYMKLGKPGYVPTEWMSLQTAVSILHDAGGVAVLAHPARYDVQWHGGQQQLVSEFKSLGGDALEVICAAHSPSDWSVYAAYCRKFDLCASLGSDFHSARESRLAIGDLPRLPSSVKPVWTLWEGAHA